jgi:uncharacterized protein (TIGR03086 family)
MKNEWIGTPVEPLGRAFASTRIVLVQVQAGQLAAPTPCASWDVQALIQHFIGSAGWAATAIGGPEAADPEAADQEAADQEAADQEAADQEAADQGFAVGDFVAAYDQGIKGALAAFGTEGALEKAVTLPWGEFSGAALMWLAVNDQFVHGWDLARAIGHDTDLDSGLADELLVRGQAWITDAYRGPDGTGLFGPSVKAPTRASSADRLAAFLGRAI